MEGLGKQGLLARAWGHEIHAVDRGFRFVDRGTWTVAYAIVVLSGIGLALVFGTFVVLGTSRGVDVSTGVPVLLGLGAVVLSAAGFLYRTYRHRRDRSEREAVDPLVVDTGDGVLKDHAGRVLARLVDVRIVVRTDWWWTAGHTQTVTLAWPGGRRVVFRSASRSKIASILKILADAGV
jgi:hypothetical protein